MKPISCLRIALLALLAAGAACAGEGDDALPSIIRDPATPVPPYSFSDADAALLEDVQHGCFNFFWNACDPATGMVHDRTSKTVISVAGVGFQLTAIPIGVEHGWITREQGAERVSRILKSLLDNPRNRKAGLYFHYLEPGTAGLSEAGYEHVVSTIDSAILFAGVITTGEYFGGEIGASAERMFAEADWRFFVPKDEEVEKPSERGCVSLGWKPDRSEDPTGPGRLLPFYWVDSGDEHRLVAFLGACAPKAEHRLPPEMYYRLRRALGRDGNSEPFVWFPWSGALFTAFFAHCWIDHAHMGADDPGAFGRSCRPRVDWWENSRRIVAMHRRKALENPMNLPTFGEHAWGLSACDGPSGYIVPGLFPTLMPMPGCTPEMDFSAYQPQDNFGDGTVAPYAAGSAIIFEPAAATAALRHYRSLNRAEGEPMLWRDPDTGGYGFQDSFRSDGWVAPDCVAIDQGPLIALIENARSGKVWRWFNGAGAVKRGKERLKVR